MLLGTICTSCSYYMFICPFNSTLQLINGISTNLQKLLRYFNGTAIVTFSRIPFAAVLPINLVLYKKDLKVSLFTILAVKLVASSLE